MGKRRRNFTAAEKVSILRRHFLDGVAVSEICNQAGFQPSQFYRWQKQFFENGVAAFESKRRSEISVEQKKIQHLEEKLQTKNDVLAELMEEHVRLKKELGGA